MKAMPTFHMQPMALTEGMKGCGSCHKIGLKSEEEIKQLKEDGQSYGQHPAMHAIQDIHFRLRKLNNRKHAKLAIWASIILNGKCIQVQNMV